MDFQFLGGTIPQWITAGALISLLGVVLKYRLGLRKIIQVDSADIRDHYALEVERLVKRVADAEARQHECEEREGRLRNRVRELEDMVDGLKRQLIAYSADKLLVMEGTKPSDIAPEATASASRVKSHTEK